jgi:microcystin-dependent protein
MHCINRDLPEQKLNYLSNLKINEMVPCIGEIRAFAGNFAPRGFHICDGSLLSISDNQTLYTLLGTAYGGDGQTTFGLPDLRGRTIVSQGRALSGTTYAYSLPGGTESVTLTNNTMPSHSHTFTVSSQPGTTTAANGSFLAAPVDPATTPKTVLFYSPSSIQGGTVTVQPLLPTAITTAGGSQPHENRMPYVTITYIIALQGVFPSRN